MAWHRRRWLLAVTTGALAIMAHSRVTALRAEFENGDYLALAEGLTPPPISPPIVTSMIAGRSLGRAPFRDLMWPPPFGLKRQSLRRAPFTATRPVWASTFRAL